MKDDKKVYKDNDLLSPQELIEHWQGAITVGTLANWRAAGTGPRYIKVGRKVFYRFIDIKRYENYKTFDAIAS